MQFAYSLDGTSFTLIGAPITVTGTPSTLPQINLSGVSALQNVPASTTITLRYYASGQTTTGGWGFNSPSAGTYGLAIGGALMPEGKVSNGTGGGDWANPNTWNPVGVPTNTEAVTILPGDVVFTLASIARNASTTVNGTFQLDAGGYATGTNFTYGGSGTLNFNDTASYGVANTDVFWPAANGPVNVNVLQGGLTMNNMTRTVPGIFTTGAGVTLNSSALRLDGICQINASGNFTNASPIYGAASTLVYNAGGNVDRGFEWMFNGVGTIGTSAGYPNNVTIQNNTFLNYNNGGPQAKALAGNLTITAGSTLSMNVGASDPQPLTIAGNLTNAGTIVLGNVPGADLRIGGNITNTSTFNGNGRAVFFTRNGVQTVSGVLSIPYVIFAPASGSTTVQLLSNMSITAPAGGNAISFNSAGDIFDLNGNAVTIGTAGVANTISGAGSFRGSTTSNLTLIGAGSAGTLRFDTGGQTLNNFTINRTAGAVAAVLGSPLTISTSLVFSAGHLDVGNNPLTIAATATMPGAGSSNYIIADGTAGAQLRKVFTAAGAFTFPVGDATSSADGNQYSPVSVNLTGGTYAAGAYVGVSVVDQKHPSYDATSEFITRYWQINTSGITAPTNFTATGSYQNADVNTPLLEANYLGNNWNGSNWLNSGSPVAAASNSTNPIPVVAGATNQVTAGRRDQEINVQAASTTYVSGSTYDFGNVLVGSTAPVTFTIQNLGQVSLTLGAASPAPTAPFVYTTAYAAGALNGPSGTRTFTVTFTPTVGGTFNGSISIPNNDPNGGESPYIINFTGVGVVPAPEINVRGVVGANPTIISGDVTPIGTDNTLFAATAIGGNQTKTFRIENIGSANLNVSSITLVGGNPGDFSVTASTPYVIPFSGTNFIDFTITFSPTTSGIRTTTVTIAHDDATDGESPYTFLIQGNGTCPAITNTITPLSGPVGTEVTITSSASLAGASVTFGSVAATAITVVSANQIKVIVPPGAISGSVETTNGLGCSASNPFTVVSNVANDCEGGITVPELFITEVTDATTGNLTYIEIFNGTGAPVNLGAYSIRVINNTTTTTDIPLSAVVLPDKDTFVLAVGAAAPFCAIPGGDGSLGDQSVSGSGINFVATENDYIALQKSGVTIDVWGVFNSNNWADGLGLGDRGSTFRRKNDVLVPSATFSLSDWEINDWAGTGAGSCGTNDYSDISNFNFISGMPPVITTHPSYTPTCKAATLTVTATEGFAGGNPLAYQWFAVAPGATTWTPLADVAPYSGTTTATLDIASVAGLEGYQFYVQVRENTATCYTASNATMISGTPTSTWNGSSWTPVPPTASSLVVINGNYNTAIYGSFECCSMVVNSGFQLNIAANTYVSVVNDLTVQNAATMFIADDGSLVMVEDDGVVTNLGTTQIQKTTSPYNKFDYTYWSSPVTATTIGAAFPGWRTDYSFSFNTSNYADILAPQNGFDDDNNAWQFAGPGASLVPGRGYAVMAPTTGTFPATSTVAFSGTVNNGVITTPLAVSGNAANANDDFVLLGNPYPSSIFANTFITTNTDISGTLYFWTHRTGISSSNPGPDANNFITTDYAMYNLSGGTSSGAGSPVPTGYVASGQGFFVEAITAADVIFNNSMRDKAYTNNQFYRMSEAASLPEERDRIWVNMERADGLFSQILVGYFPEATMDVDRGYDGLVNQTSNSISLYTFIGEDKYRIQGRSSFDETDRVPMGYRANLSGTYTIGIGSREGQLNAPGRNVYIEDNLLGITHDLTQGPYVFSTDVGTVNDRFVLKYVNSELGVDVPQVPESTVMAYADGNTVFVKSTSEEISGVAIFDIAGRRVFQADGINALEAIAGGMPLARQALIVRITLRNKQEVVRKILM